MLIHENRQGSISRGALKKRRQRTGIRPILLHRRVRRESLSSFGPTFFSLIWPGELCRLFAKAEWHHRVFPTILHVTVQYIYIYILLFCPLGPCLLMLTRTDPTRGRKTPESEPRVFRWLECLRVRSADRLEPHDLLAGASFVER